MRSSRARNALATSGDALDLAGPKTHTQPVKAVAGGINLLLPHSLLKSILRVSRSHWVLLASAVIEFVKESGDITWGSPKLRPH